MKRNNKNKIQVVPDLILVRSIKAGVERFHNQDLVNDLKSRYPKADWVEIGKVFDKEVGMFRRMFKKISEIVNGKFYVKHPTSMRHIKHIHVQDGFRDVINKKKNSK